MVNSNPCDPSREVCIAADGLLCHLQGIRHERVFDRVAIVPLGVLQGALLELFIGLQGLGSIAGGKADTARRLQCPDFLFQRWQFFCRDSDTAAEVAAKLTLIAIYNERLTERKRRREFIQHHGLLDVKPQQARDVPNADPFN